MSRALSWKQATCLGMVVVLISGLALFGLFAIGERQGVWSGTLHVYVGFPRVQGVEVGTRVRIQGVDAGEVVAVQAPAIPGEAVVLRLRLADKFHDLVRADATVEIALEGLLGGKVIEIAPGTPGALRVADDACLASRPTIDINELLNRAQVALATITDGNGTVGKLINDPQAYTTLVAAIKQSQQTLASVQQNTDALKKMPILRSYVEDPVPMLIRPNAECHREVVAAQDLFEPGRAVLTDAGKQRLDTLAPWLEGLKIKDSEVVIAGFSDPDRFDPVMAHTLTRLQSQAVCDYLVQQHRVQKMGWFSSRKVSAIGVGGDTIPADHGAKLPADRIEILVFLPVTGG